MLNALAYDTWVLHALIWLPLLGMVHVLWAAEDRAKGLALRWSLVVFVLSVGLWWAYDPALGGGYQLEGVGVQLFSRVEGDYFAILGLPLLPLLDFLRGHRVIAP